MLARLAGPFCRIKIRKIRPQDANRPYLGIFAAPFAAHAKLSAGRVGAAGVVRSRGARLCRHPGQAARRISQGRIESREPALHLFLRRPRAAAERGGARSSQFGADRAVLADADLGMGHPRPAADHGARLQRADADPDGQRAAEGTEAGRFRIPDQGRQISGKHVVRSHRGRDDPLQAGNLYGRALDLWRPPQDHDRAARA